MMNLRVKPASSQRIRSVLVANRGEIAIRVMRAANELGLRTVAIYSQEDRFSLHRTKADEAYLVGAGQGPVQAYLDIADILRIAGGAQVDAIHPGYGFLAENPEFAEACASAGIVFVGPAPQTMRLLGDKVAARALAVSAGVPVMPATGALPHDALECARAVAQVGYPVMLKASWGGGGRGTRVVEGEAQLAELLAASRREALAGFGNDAVCGEAGAPRPPRRGAGARRRAALVHLFERDCNAQPQPEGGRALPGGVSERRSKPDCAMALDIAAPPPTRTPARWSLQDADSGSFTSSRSTRIQVERSPNAPPASTSSAQLRIAAGARIGTPESGVPPQAEIRIGAHALQCRITTEDPENDFIPDYGKISAYRSPAGFGVRLDAGTAYTGAIITRSYDSLLVKVTAWSPTRRRPSARMHRALAESASAAWSLTCAS
jgi:pyruvate carboxylase